MKQDDLVDIRSQVTEKELRAYAESHERTSDRPRTLRPEAILVADKVFQRRDWDTNIGGHIEHAKGFITTLRETEKPFDPVTVIPIGDQWYLVDGHYRMIAYRSLGWQYSIPVRILECDIEGAWLESLRLNAKHGMPMSLEERSEAAWHLVKADKLWRAHIVKETNVSRSTVATMRRTLAEMTARGETPGDMTWKEVRSGRPREDFDAETHRTKRVAELQRKLLGALGPGMARQADYLAEAIALAYPGLPEALIEHWPEAVRSARETREAFEALDI